jgi:hypothetical protein
VSIGRLGGSIQTKLHVYIGVSYAQVLVLLLHVGRPQVHWTQRVSGKCPARVSQSSIVKVGVESVEESSRRPFLITDRLTDSID